MKANKKANLNKVILGKYLKFWSILILAMVLTGCGGGSSPEEVAEKYTKATLQFDYGAMKKLASEKNKAGIEKQEAETKEQAKDPKMQEKMELFKNMKVTGSEAAKVSEDGNSATVKVLALDKDKKESSFKVSLVKENDAWKAESLSK